MKTQIMELALKEYFVRETASPTTSNPRVLEYFAAAGASWVKDDSLNAWCSAFMNWLAKTAGLATTRSLLARSWLDVGQPTETPEIGDLVVFWRDSIESGHGHVSLFIKKEGDYIVCLGGNQSDEVNISRYLASRVMGYRDITKPTPPKPKALFDRMLSFGSNGEDVKILQKIIGAKVDGDFGPKTLEAVKTFQSLYNLKVDGVVGPKTQAILSTLVK